MTVIHPVWAGVIACAWLAGLALMAARGPAPFAVAFDWLVDLMVWLGTVVTPGARRRELEREQWEADERRTRELAEVETWLLGVLTRGDRRWLRAQEELLPTAWAVLGAQSSRVLVYSHGVLGQLQAAPTLAPPAEPTVAPGGSAEAARTTRPQG